MRKLVLLTMFAMALLASANSLMANPNGTVPHPSCEGDCDSILVDIEETKPFEYLSDLICCCVKFEIDSTPPYISPYNRYNSVYFEETPAGSGVEDCAQVHAGLLADDTHPGTHVTCQGCASEMKLITTPIPVGAMSHCLSGGEEPTGFCCEAHTLNVETRTVMPAVEICNRIAEVQGVPSGSGQTNGVPPYQKCVVHHGVENQDYTAVNSTREVYTLHECTEPEDPSGGE